MESLERERGVPWRLPGAESGRSWLDWTFRLEIASARSDARIRHFEKRLHRVIHLTAPSRVKLATGSEDELGEAQSWARIDIGHTMKET